MLSNLLVKFFFQNRLAYALRSLERPQQVEECVVTQYPNPVLSVGNQDSWDSKYASWASVVHDGTLWRMYYTGKDKYGFNRIGLANSKQGLKWEKTHYAPILDIGPINSWDAVSVHCPIVWKENTSWKMLYTGCNSHKELHYQIGLATSQDGINWTKYEYNPVFNSNHNWDINKRQHHETEGWGLLFDNAHYYLFYNPITRKPRQIGIAQSSDLVSWKSLSSHPILPSRGHSWDLSYMKYCASPFKLKNKLYLLVSMSDMNYIRSKIGLYRLDGKLPSLERVEFLGYVLDTYAKWCQKELDTPFVIQNASRNELRCYYGGRSNKNEWTVGLASIKL